MPLTEEQRRQLKALEDVALERMLEKVGFDVQDWLFMEELTEYKELRDNNHQ